MPPAAPIGLQHCMRHAPCRRRPGGTPGRAHLAAKEHNALPQQQAEGVARHVLRPAGIRAAAAHVQGGRSAAEQEQAAGGRQPLPPPAGGKRRWVGRRPRAALGPSAPLHAPRRHDGLLAGQDEAAVAAAGGAHGRRCPPGGPGHRHRAQGGARGGSRACPAAASGHGGRGRQCCHHCSRAAARGCWDGRAGLQQSQGASLAAMRCPAAPASPPEHPDERTGWPAPQEGAFALPPAFHAAHLIAGDAPVSAQALCPLLSPAATPPVACRTLRRPPALLHAHTRSSSALCGHGAPAVHQRAGQALQRPERPADQRHRRRQGAPGSRLRPGRPRPRPPAPTPPAAARRRRRRCLRACRDVQHHARRAAPPPPQVLLNDDNIADIQAEYEGPGAGLGRRRWGMFCTQLSAGSSVGCARCRWAK